MYWQVDDKILGTPGISELMSRNRFQQIGHFLHLADNSEQDLAGHARHNKLFKVRNLLRRSDNVQLTTLPTRQSLP